MNFHCHHLCLLVTQNIIWNATLVRADKFFKSSRNPTIVIIATPRKISNRFVAHKELKMFIAINMIKKAKANARPPEVGTILFGTFNSL